MSAFLIILAAAIAGWSVYRWKRRRKRRRLLAAPLSPGQRAFVARHVSLYRRLSPALRAKLEGKINLFLDQVTFLGCDGLEVTEEMRLAIAGQACLLVLNKDNRWYDDLFTILVYPGPFKTRHVETDGFIETVSEEVRSGESWALGPVVLSWADAERGAFIDDDGHNVVIHEFAHQLDEQSGDSDGAPLIDRNQDSAEWARIFRTAYERLLRDAEAGRETILDPYGAEAPAEFFAVAVECFFETPAALKRAEPDLYDQLAAYFRLDPATLGARGRDAP